MKTLIFLFLIGIFTICSASKCNKRECINQENLALESTCFSAVVLTQGNPFPNPVSAGSNLSLNMKIAAIGNPLALLPVTISTKVYSFGTGQLVAQLNSGTVQSSASFQNVPIWTNISVASGSYYIEVTVDAGVCGSKTICFNNFKIVVVR